ncbi:MAG TPA: hypothetical protein VEQ85_05830, partial [Lacipirellulaceae bacterium]|nr:hypothetical protein [Lacipirellulaceae bacterium]
PGAAPASPAEVCPGAAAAASRGLLQDAVQGAASDPSGGVPSDALRGRLAELAWQDLLLAAACAHRSEPANRRLLDLIQTEVLPALARKWGRDRASDLADDLPQILHIRDERGLNRGRIRLLAYGGRSRLATWLRSVAHREGIDRWRRGARHEAVEDLAETADDGAAADASARMVEAEDLALIRRVGPQAFEQLMRQLPNESEQQHRFAYFRCVERLDNSEIAARLGVGKSRVTELSQQVFRRMMAILSQLAPELDAISSEATKERRRNVEEALQEWFGSAARLAPLGADPSARTEIAAPHPQGGAP